MTRDHDELNFDDLGPGERLEVVDAIAGVLEQWAVYGNPDQQGFAERALPGLRGLLEGDELEGDE